MKTIPNCINLRERFGRRFRIDREESYGRTDDPWLLLVRCKFGHIFPNGGNVLAASVDGHPNVAAVLRRLPCCRIHQDGDFGELTVLFDVADFAKVAKIMCRAVAGKFPNPKRRQWSPGSATYDRSVIIRRPQKGCAAMVARLRTRRQVGEFKPIHGHPTTRRCVPTARRGSEVEQTHLPFFARRLPIKESFAGIYYKRGERPANCY